ncbi:hypothetical protein ZWY2020_028149 [Hordeum vulgare]|nr:hypothetical protein ZWY2020_028149 [Hordeum vulgare]
MDEHCSGKAVQDLVGDNQEIREKLREITGWFPSIEMMRNHARGLIKVMREDEKLHAFPQLLRPTFRCHPLGDEGGATHHRPDAARKVVDVPLIQDDGTAAGSYPACLEDGEGDRSCKCALAAVLDPEVQIIPPVFTSGNKKKKPVVGVVRRSERLKNLKNN